MMNLFENDSSINLELNFSFSAYSKENDLFSIKLFIEKEYLNFYCMESEKKEYFCKVTFEELKNNKILSKQ